MLTIPECWRHSVGGSSRIVNKESDELVTRQEFARRWLEVEPSVAAYVFGAISRFHDAEDVTQHIAQELARRFDEYDSQRPFVGWALWIAKSRVIDFYRKQGRDRLVLSEDMLQKLAEVIVDRQSHRDDRRAALEQCLDRLPERSRRLLDLRYVEELPAERMAEAVGSTAGSVRVLLTRVRHVLAECIQKRLSADSV